MTTDFFALHRVLECRVDDVFGRDDLPLRDDIFHLRKEGDHDRMWFHLL